jgi:hypothetical protein
VAFPGDPIDYASTLVIPRGTQYGRMRNGAEVFGSKVSPRHAKGAYVQANESVDSYAGQVQFYFVHCIKTPDGEWEKHFLAYVLWYLPTRDAAIRYLLSPDGTEKRCIAELWHQGFYKPANDNWVLVHNILGKFVPVNYKHKKTVYLASVPLSRRINVY